MARPTEGGARWLLAARAACGLALVAAATACSALPWPQREHAAGGALGEEGLLDLRGVVHVHTRDSHDSPGDIGDVAEAARATGVDWVALTEHARPGGPPARGQVRGVIILPGFELRAGGGSLLALGLGVLPPDRRDLAAVVRATHAAGGVALLGHIETSRLMEPAAYAELGVDGIELVNLHAAAQRAGFLELLVGNLLLPPWLSVRPLLRHPAQNLVLWQRLPEARSIVGGVDAHARVRLLGPVGGTLDSYRRAFALLTTHVLARERSPEAILSALRHGQSYVAYEGLGRVDAFRFSPSGSSFQLRAPAEARLVLSCDGRPVAEAQAAAADLPIPPDAVSCHAEAWLGNRLWIVTSRRAARSALHPATARSRVPLRPWFERAVSPGNAPS